MLNACPLKYWSLSTCTGTELESGQVALTLQRLRAHTCGPVRKGFSAVIFISGKRNGISLRHLLISPFLSAMESRTVRHQRMQLFAYC